MTLEGSVPIYNTEDPEKVKASVLNIFPGSDIRLETDSLSFSVVDTSRFESVVEDLEIGDTAASVLEAGLKEDRTEFFLNKQAASMGKVNFTDGTSNLGDIFVSVTTKAVDLIEKIKPEMF